MKSSPKSISKFCFSSNRWKCLCLSSWVLFGVLNMVSHTWQKYGGLSKQEAVIVSPFQISILDRMIGEPVAFEGKIVRAGQSRSGKTRYLNFAMNREESAAIAFQCDEQGIGNQFPFARLKEFEGKRVHAEGTLTKSHGQPMIFIRHEWQIRELDPSPSTLAQQ